MDDITQNDIKLAEDFFLNGKSYDDRVEDIKDPSVHKIKHKGKKSKIIKKILSGFLTVIISLVLVGVITSTIVASAFSIYVLDFMDEVSDDVTIEDLERTYNTYVYAYNKKKELVKLYEVKNGSSGQAIPVKINEIPQHVRDAFVNTEDERFYSHDGVDYKRTFSAFMNMFIHIYDTDQGGSTITQQLVKTITGDNERSPARKIREIFRAMQLEKSYSKDEILESYLNDINFGGTTTGIEAASIKYFGKHVEDLDIAEAASLAAIPKSPSLLNPFADEKANKKRQEYVLRKMYDNGAITYDEYEQALNEKLIFTNSDNYTPLEGENDQKEIDDYDSSKATTWVVDTAINEFADYLSKNYNLTNKEAISRINSGGYQIYTTVDLDMQNYVEKRYQSISNLMPYSLANKTLDNGSTVTPQSAFIAMDYKGEIQAIVGAVGKKKESLCWNYATMEYRQPGSSIKPLTTYGAGIESGIFSWGTLIEDKPLVINGQQWPTNYSTNSSVMKYSGNNVSLYYGLEKSLNTISARICNALTPNIVYRFATQRMGLQLVSKSDDGKLTDNALSPLSVGALTKGVTLENLVNGYVPYGNDGKRYEAHIISKVEKGNHELVYDNSKIEGTQAVSADTAIVMNRLLQNVVKNGTGKAAQLKNTTVAGKTGTTQDWNDLLFVGLTPDFVSGVWIGYAEGERIPLNTYISSATVWKNIIGDYAELHTTQKEFPSAASGSVVEDYVCTYTGLIAGENCPKSAEKGYWRADHAPRCTGKHYGIWRRKGYSQNTTESATESTTLAGGFQSGADAGDNAGGDFGAAQNNPAAVAGQGDQAAQNAGGNAG